MPNADIVVTIGTNWLGRWIWAVGTQPKEEATKALSVLPQKHNPWTVFKGLLAKTNVDQIYDYIQRLNSTEPEALARHVLGLGTVYSPSQRDNAYATLCDIYNKDTEIDKAICSVALQAKEILSGKRVNFSEHIFSSKQKRWIRDGKKVLCSIMDGTVKKPKKCLAKNGQLNNPGARYLKDIVVLMWYFYDIARQRRQNFSEGTFVIQDPGFKIYNYLLDYVKCVNPEITGNASKDRANNFADNNFAYSRASSHYKYEQKQYNTRHYGIDIVPTTANVKLPTYPEKEHLLFGKVGEGDLIFIKPETHGLGAGAVAGHGISFVQAQGRKVAPAVFGSDDAELYRKERVPKDFINRCRQILNVESSSSTETEESINAKKYLLEMLLKQGMMFLQKIFYYKLLEKPTALVAAGDPEEISFLKYYRRNKAEDENLKKQFAAVSKLTKEELENLWGYFVELKEQYDNVSMRYGREVIITQQDIDNTCKQK